jgi:hypothetical protein
MNHFCHARGFTCNAEVLGSFLEKTCDKDEIDAEHPTVLVQTTPSRVVKFGSTCKQPLCTTLEDVKALKDATIKCDPRHPEFGDAGLRKLIAAANNSIPEKDLLAETEKLLDAAELATAKAAKIGMASEKAAISRFIPNAGTVVDNTVKAISTAMSILHFRPGNDTDPVQRLALDLYMENQLGDGNEDAKRIRRFAEFTTFMTGPGYDPSKAHGTGHGQFWFDETHLAEITDRLTGCISNSRIEQAQERARGYRIDRGVLALVAATIVKNVAKNAGQAPVAAIKAMLEHYQIPSHGTQVRECLTILVEARIVALVDYTFSVGRCRRWAVAKPAWFTFVPAESIVAQDGRSHTATGFTDFAGIARDRAADEARKHQTFDGGIIVSSATNIIEAAAIDPVSFFANGFWGDPSQTAIVILGGEAGNDDKNEVFGEFNSENDDFEGI